MTQYQITMGRQGVQHSEKCGVLGSFCRTREAAQNWELELGGFMKEMGLWRGRPSTCLPSDSRPWCLRSCTGMRCHHQGTEQHSQRNGRRSSARRGTRSRRKYLERLEVLNRRVRWSPQALWIEADRRHLVEVARALGLEGTSPSSTPGVAVKG